MRRPAVLLLAATALTGCYRTHPVFRPQSGQTVTVRYGDPGQPLRVTTRNREVVEILSATRISGSVVVVRKDSVELEVHEVEPRNGKVYGGRAVVPLPGVNATPQTWTTQKLDAKRTAYAVLGPPVILLLVLAALISAAAGGGY